jgi:hypothetical protein
MTFEELFEQLIQEATERSVSWRDRWIEVRSPDTIEAALRELPTVGPLMPAAGEDLGIHDSGYYPEDPIIVPSPLLEPTIRAQQYGPYSDGSSVRTLSIHFKIDERSSLRVLVENDYYVLRDCWSFLYADTGYEGHARVDSRDHAAVDELVGLIAERAL